MEPVQKVKSIISSAIDMAEVSCRTCGTMMKVLVTRGANCKRCGQMFTWKKKKASKILNMFGVPYKSNEWEIVWINRQHMPGGKIPEIKG